MKGTFSRAISGFGHFVASAKKPKTFRSAANSEAYPPYSIAVREKNPLVLRVANEQRSKEESGAMQIIAFPIFYQKVGPFRSFNRLLQNLLFANGIISSQISLDKNPPLLTTIACVQTSSICFAAYVRCN